jgi:cbb3-type cytochrome oxidase subunit 3
VAKPCVKIVLGIVIVLKSFFEFCILGIVWRIYRAHERKINDSYKLLNGKCPEETQRETKNPVIEKKVTIIPFSDESRNPLSSRTNKVIKWIVITIEMVEKEIWVSICSKVANSIRIRSHYKIGNFELNPFSNLLYSFSGMPPLGLKPRCLSTAS